MKPISLLLTNQHGDELGRMRLATLQAAAPGEQATNNRRADLAPQMAQTYERLRLALAQEGFEADGDQLDVQIRVSRALLAKPPAGEELLIPLPVHPVSPLPTSEPLDMASAISAADPKPEDWDDLFDLSPDAEQPMAASQSDAGTSEIDVCPARTLDDLGLADQDEE